MSVGHPREAAQHAAAIARLPRKASEPYQEVLGTLSTSQT